MVALGPIHAVPIQIACIVMKLIAMHAIIPMANNQTPNWGISRFKCLFHLFLDCMCNCLIKIEKNIMKESFFYSFLNCDCENNYLGPVGFRKFR